jgi:hypothetical protein
VQFRTARPARHPLPFRRVTDHADLRRLHLRVERAMLAQRQLQSLVIEAGATLAELRREIRDVKARVARTARKGKLFSARTL